MFGWLDGGIVAWLDCRMDRCSDGWNIEWLDGLDGWMVA